MKEEIIDLTANLFSNGAYSRPSQSATDPLVPSRDDQLFYKKRIVRILKDMLRGKESCPRLQTIHDEYVKGVIGFIQDHDILCETQKKYDDLSLTHSSLPKSSTSSLCASKVLRNSDDMRMLSGRSTVEKGSLKKFVKFKSKSQNIDFPEIESLNIKAKGNRSRETVLKTL